MSDFRLKLISAAAALKLQIAQPQMVARVLPGVQGVQGLQGIQGIQGVQGATGATGAGYTATSTTSLTIGTGSKAFTTQAGLAYTVGARARASSAANGANYMEGLVTAYGGTTLTINVTQTGGSGTLADWNINLAGDVGATGNTGATGPTTALEWLFDTTTSDADPGSGNVRFNNATFGSITQIFFDNNERNGASVATWLDAFDDSTTTALRGFLVIVKVTDTTVFRIFSVTGAVVDGSGYRKVPVSPIVSNGALATSDRVSVLFTRTGDKGADGVGTGDVVGPASSIDSEIVLFNSTTGKLIKRATGTGVVHATAGVYSVSTVVTAEIGDDQVTYAKIQNVSATDRILGRDTVGAGDIEELTVSGGLEFTGTGIQRSALTGDVTATAGNNATTIANNAVSYAKMQDISATARFLGRITAGAGDTEELTGTQATTLLDAFTTSLKGLAPASGGGTTNFLRADGAWAAAGGGAAAGQVIQVVATTYTAATGITTAIPNDDTVPQSTEGTQILSQSITPASSSNKILCIVDMWGYGESGSSGLTAVLLRSTTAINVARGTVQESDASSSYGINSQVGMSFLDSPATASAVTYSVRVGHHTAGNNLTINGENSARKYGGASTATLILMEVKG